MGTLNKSILFTRYREKYDSIILDELLLCYNVQGLLRKSCKVVITLHNTSLQERMGMQRSVEHFYFTAYYISALLRVLLNYALQHWKSCIQ